MYIFLSQSNLAIYLFNLVSNYIQTIMAKSLSERIMKETSEGLFEGSLALSVNPGYGPKGMPLTSYTQLK